MHQESFKKYVGTILTRKNTRTDMYYRDDPSIFGWEIANEPSNPGDDSGDVVQVRHKGFRCTQTYLQHRIPVVCSVLQKPDAIQMLSIDTARAF